MDEGKLKVLQEIGYVVRETCSTCLHSTFRPGSTFGTCDLHGYDHQKHTEARRQLSVNRSGWCKSYIASPEREHELHRFSEFLEKK